MHRGRALVDVRMLFQRVHQVSCAEEKAEKPEECSEVDPLRPQR